MFGLDVDKLVRDITKTVEKNLGMVEVLELLRSIDKSLKEIKSGVEKK